MVGSINIFLLVFAQTQILEEVSKLQELGFNGLLLFIGVMSGRIIIYLHKNYVSEIVKSRDYYRDKLHELLDKRIVHEKAIIDAHRQKGV